MLQGEYQKAVQLILQPREGEREETAEARRLYLEKGALPFFPLPGTPPPRPTTPRYPPPPPLELILQP